MVGGGFREDENHGSMGRAVVSLCYSTVADYGDPNSSHVKNDPNSHVVRACLLAANLNSHSTKFFYDSDTQLWEAKGNMSEAAIVVGAAKARFDSTKILEEYVLREDLEVPFSSARKMCATVHKLKVVNEFGDMKFGGGASFAVMDDVDQISVQIDENRTKTNGASPASSKGAKHETNGASPASSKGAKHDFTHVAVVKGAPDRLFPWIRALPFSSPSSPNTLSLDANDAPLIDKHDMENIETQNKKFANQALRCLAVCLLPLTDADIAALEKMDNPPARKTVGENQTTCSQTEQRYC